MSSLDSIAVTVEQDTGNLRPLLHEIRHALERLLENGEPTFIDLKSIPMAPSEAEKFELTLERIGSFNKLEERMLPDFFLAPIGHTVEERPGDACRGVRYFADAGVHDAVLHISLAGEGIVSGFFGDALVEREKHRQSAGGRARFSGKPCFDVHIFFLWKNR